jgi:purine operon repressor
MKKITKGQRLSLITKKLVDNPFKLFTLNYFSELFDCAKSTLSEDITSIEEAFKSMHEGAIISVSGASGGIYFAPYYSKQQIEEVKKEICVRLNDYQRVIPGGFVYMNDLFFDPSMLKKMARCIVTRYRDIPIDYIVTIETKGIPLAMSIAHELNIPVAVIRKSARLSEGTTIQMNYVTGSQRTIKTMALPIRSIARGSNILLVDDFMKAGGTAKGIKDLVSEFDAKVIGVAVVLATKTPQEKLINDYYTLVEYDGVDDEAKEIRIKPSE